MLNREELAATKTEDLVLRFMDDPGNPVHSKQIELEIARRHLVEQRELTRMQANASAAAKEAAEAASFSADAALRSARAAERTSTWTMVSAWAIAISAIATAVSAWALLQNLPKG